MRPPRHAHLTTARHHPPTHPTDRPDPSHSYFYNTETGMLQATRPDDVVIDKTTMFITELNRRRREDFYVKLKMAAAEGLLQNQLEKKCVVAFVRAGVWVLWARDDGG
jgi:hypothetical protein